MPGREAKLIGLLGCLEPQIKIRDDVELLVLRDLRSLTIGEKRNRMISIARGEYVIFVDDDDAVTTDYVAAIASMLRSHGPDVLCFTVTVRGQGPDKPCRYDPSMRTENLAGEYRRKPNHLMAWRRALAASVPFPTLRFGEDTQWADAMAKLAKNVATIDRALYVYQFDASDNSSTPR